MTTLSIPDATYQRLAEQAAGLHLTMEAFLDRMAQGVEPAPTAGPTVADRDRAFDDLCRLVGAAGDPVSPPETDPASLTTEEWLRRHRDWTREVEARADRYPPGFTLDDSRGSIYAEREDAQR